MKTNSLRELSCFFVLSFAATAAFAVDYTWTGEARNGKWQDAGNWSGGDAYPQSYADTATFPAGEVTLTDTPANCGTVTLNEGATLVFPEGATVVDWKGLCGPGTLVKRGSATLWSRNDAQGYAIYGNVVLRLEEGSFGVSNDGEMSHAYSGKDGTLGDCTIVLAGGAVVNTGWPTFEGTMTLEVPSGVASANFLTTTLRSNAGSQIVKTGAGTLTVGCKFDSNYTKNDFQVNAGEVVFAGGCDMSGTLSGTGAVSATPQLRLRADNTDFTGTIRLHNENDSVMVSHTCAALNATFEFLAQTSALVVDVNDPHFLKPLDVPEGKTVNFNVGSHWTWLFGCKGPGKVVKTGTSPLVFLNRLEDKTGAVSDNLQLDIDEGGIQFYSGHGGYSSEDAVFCDATLTYHVASTGSNFGWTGIGGTLTIRTDYDVTLTANGVIRGTGSIVKEGSGTLTIGGGLGNGSGDPFDGDIVIREGKVVIVRNTGNGYQKGKIVGPGTFELQSSNAYLDYMLAEVTAPYVCRGGLIDILPGASFNDLALVDGAKVRIKTLVDPLRIHGTLTTSGETKSVIDATSRAGSSGTCALVLSKSALDASAFDFALPQGWTLHTSANRIYARTEGSANFWIGGAGTANWGDAANWADGVPSGNVVFYTDDTPVLDVPADSTGTVFVRGSGDIVFSGEGLGGLTFDCGALTDGRFVKCGPATCLAPKTTELSTFVVSEGIVKRQKKTLAANIIVEDGAQFDVNGVGDPDPNPTYTIAGSGPDGTGALVNTGADVNWDVRQGAGLVLTDDATIGCASAWGLVNGGYAETLLELNEFTLTKIGAEKFWMANVSATNSVGTFVLAEGGVRLSNSARLNAMTFVWEDGTAPDLQTSADYGSLVCGKNLLPTIGSTIWINVFGRLETHGALTVPHVYFKAGSTFAPDGPLTISAADGFGGNLTLDLSSWQESSGKTLLEATAVTLKTFGTVVGLPEKATLVAKNDRLFLKLPQGIMIIFR